MEEDGSRDLEVFVVMTVPYDFERIAVVKRDALFVDGRGLGVIQRLIHQYPRTIRRRS